MKLGRTVIYASGVLVGYALWGTTRHWTFLILGVLLNLTGVFLAESEELS